MRSSPEAPDRVLADGKKSPASTSVLSSPFKTSTSGTKISVNNVNDNVLPRRSKTTQPQFLPATTQLVNSSFQSIPKHHGFSTLDSKPHVLNSSSISNERGNIPNTSNSSNYADVHNYHRPAAGCDRNDDISNPSTDDPYTYSDDSASFSDAYFRQQPSLDTVIANTKEGQFGLIPLPSSYGDEGDLGSTNLPIWPGPPWIHLDGKLSPRTGIPKRDRTDTRTNYSRSSRRYDGKDQCRQQLQQKEEQNVSLFSSDVDREEPIDEKTSLLVENRISKTRQRDKNPKKRNKLARRKYSNRAVVKSNSHRQQRKKLELRKLEQNLLLQVQQKRQEERERAVSEVRGRPQPLSSKRNRFWLFLFNLQLLLVSTFAIKYGLTFYRPPRDLDQDLSSLSSSAVNVSSSGLSLMLVNDFDNKDDIIQTEDMDPFLSTQEFSTNGVNDANQSEVLTNSKEQTFTIDYKNVLSLLVISGIYACITSYLSFAFMLILGRSIIPIMLVFTVLLMICWGLFGLALNNDAGLIISIGGFIVFVISFAYTMSNWNQIPFCSTNLHTAICAIRSSIGILLVGISSLFVGLFWLFIWTIALMGTFNRHNSVDCEIWDECETHVYVIQGRMIELGLLLVSLYWTTMVIKNIVRVVVAGVIGGPWWFDTICDGADDKLERGQKPTFDRFCGCRNSSIVFDPLVRAFSCSLGTICFGSLVDFPTYLLSMIVTCLCWLIGCSDDGWNVDPSSEHSNEIVKITPMRTSEKDINDDAVRAKETSKIDNTNANEVVLLPSQQRPPATFGTQLRMFRKLMRRLDRVLQFCNHWSYTYIGMYNYSYFEGGEKAIQLFETREWMDIARDTLIQNILLMTSMFIGGFTGCVAVMVEEVDGYEFTSLHKPILTSFLIGFFLGSILSYILLLGVAGSAVNTVLVCFAAEPFEFDRNHPLLSREMREVWSEQVWESDGIDD